eukprot:277398-Rhodomonas_salina.2
MHTQHHFGTDLAWRVLPQMALMIAVDEKHIIARMTAAGAYLCLLELVFAAAVWQELSELTMSPPLTGYAAIRSAILPRGRFATGSARYGMYTLSSFALATLCPVLVYLSSYALARLRPVLTCTARCFSTQCLVLTCALAMLCPVLTEAMLLPGIVEGQEADPDVHA